MRKIVLVFILALLLLFVFKNCIQDKSNQTIIKEHSALIQQQIKNVGKLVVTEGYFSDAYGYSDIKDLGFNLTSEKQALVVVNAEVTVGYDLSKIKFTVDSINRVLKIKSIPEEELKIHPKLEYYDVESGYFNAFGAEDYNKINKIVTERITKKVEASNLRANAKNRLISELSKFYILTNSLGWTLQYNESEIKDLNKLETIKL